MQIVYISDKIHRVFGRGLLPDNLTLGINQEFVEVPLDLAAPILFLQPYEERVCIFTHYLDLLEYGEFHVKFVPSIFLNLYCSVWFLSPKLIAWEG